MSLLATPPTSIGSLFDGSIQFSVPSYQRAYSWQVDSGVNSQVKQFLRDIREQDPSRKYYLGHFLFSKIENTHYEVIDGQQRLTTVIIFMSSLISECRERGISFLGDNENGDVDLIEETYLIHRKQKFMTVPEDQTFFQNRIVRMKRDAVRNTNRSSEARIQDAADYFQRELHKSSLDELTNLYRIVRDSTITTYVVEGTWAKEVATQVFAFQNDRGKKLTNLEIVKAYLMNQIYRYSDDANAYIPSIEASFATIYSEQELIKTSEDTILNWHCSAFLPESADTAVDKVKIVVAKSDEKDVWAGDFSAALAKTFKFIREVEKYEARYSGYIADLCFLDKSNSMPLLIKLHHIGVLDDTTKRDSVLRLIERILFKMTYTTGWYKTNDLVSYARKLTAENFESWFLPTLREASERGFKQYWDFNGNCLRFFAEQRDHYHSNIKYVLYKYENWLRRNAGVEPLSIDACVAVFREKKIENTLDHITPQNPTFTTYTEEFVKNYLCNIGNLSLLTWSGNASKSNSDPIRPEIRDRYNQVYLSQKEVYKVLCAGKWGEEEIDIRRDKILGFVKEQWLS